MRTIFKKKKKKSQVLPAVDPVGDATRNEPKIAQNEATETVATDEACLEETKQVEQQETPRAVNTAETEEKNEAKADAEVIEVSERVEANVEEQREEHADVAHVHSGWNEMFQICCNDDGVILKKDIISRCSSVIDNEELRIQFKLVEFLFFSDRSQADQRVDLPAFGSTLDAVLALQHEDLLGLVYDFFQFITTKQEEADGVDLGTVTEALTNMSVKTAAESKSTCIFADKASFVSAHLQQLRAIQ